MERKKHKFSAGGSQLTHSDSSEGDVKRQDTPEKLLTVMIRTMDASALRMKEIHGYGSGFEDDRCCHVEMSRRN